MYKVKFYLTVFFIFFYFFSAFAFDKLDAFSIYKLNYFKSLKDIKDKELVFKSLNYPYLAKQDKIYLAALLQISGPSKFLENYGCEILVEVGDIVAVNIPIDRLEDLIDDPKVLRLSASKMYKPNLDSVRKKVNIEKVHLGENLPKKYLGENVIIGIFDTGIDLYHPDFSDENGTRVLYLWDMSDDFSGGSPPRGYTWGREYTKAQIDSNISSVVQKDFFGHGTSVASVASGNGRGKINYLGIAPKASLIIVKGTTEPHELDFTDQNLIAGCKYIFEKAKELGKPCVINLSLGFVLGSHDGEDLVSKAIDNLISEEKGRAVVASAGNLGDFNIHSGGILKIGQRKELLFVPVNLCDILPWLCPDIPNYFLIGAEVWTETGVVDSVYVGIYRDNRFIAEKAFAFSDLATNVQLFDDKDSVAGLISFAATQNYNGDNITVFINNGGFEEIDLTKYYWSIVFVPKKSGRLDSWCAFPIGEQHPFKTRFSRFVSDSLMTIAAPATAKLVVSVGAFVSKNRFIDIWGNINDQSDNLPMNSLAGYSSLGPSRDGRVLPTIVAPGSIVFSALASSVEEFIDSTSLDPSGIYFGVEGTSFAAPVVSGAIALLLEQRPNISVSEIIELVKRAGRSDIHTGPTPNYKAGWGKLDVYQLLGFINSVNELTEHKKVAVFPNPTSDYATIFSDEELVEFVVLNSLGQKICSGYNHKIDLAIYPSGVYFVQVQTKNGSYLTTLIKL
ncbi:MAG: S8 family peptidase [Ignavibacteria bacterium]|nr:S8 family peptidase [Ignavibacteria bacterium]